MKKINLKKYFVLLFLIVLFSFAFVEAQTTTRSGTPSADLASETVCDNVQRCQQIDQVWQRLSLRASYPNADLVWDPILEEWRSSGDVYHETIITTSAETEEISVGSVSGTRIIAGGSGEDYQKKCMVESFGWYAKNKLDEDELFLRYDYSQLENLPGVDVRPVTYESVELLGLTRSVNSVMADALRIVNQQLIVAEIDYEIHGWHSCRVNGDRDTETAYAPDCGSFHLACLAIDINPQENPHCPNNADATNWWGRIPSDEERERCQNREIVTDIPQEMVEIFENNGFYWGGRFGNPDSMHFEYVNVPPYCCSRTFGPLTYTLTPESSFITNPKCLWGRNDGDCCSQLNPCD